MQRFNFCVLFLFLFLLLCILYYYYNYICKILCYGLNYTVTNGTLTGSDNELA